MHALNYWEVMGDTLGLTTLEATVDTLRTLDTLVTTTTTILLTVMYSGFIIRKERIIVCIANAMGQSSVEHLITFYAPPDHEMLISCVLCLQQVRQTVLV